MAQPDPSDETLMAYADGELSADEAARIARLLETDAAAAAKVAAFRQTRARLRAAARSHDAVPAALRARVEAALAGQRAAQPPDAGTVTPLAPRRRRQVPAAPAALAASLALAVGLAAGWLAAPGGDGAAGGGVVDLAGLEDALGRVPSGETAALDGGEITLVASFRDSAGAFCREAEVARTGRPTVIVVACRGAGGDWQPQLALAAGGGAGYAPASGTRTLEAFLDSIGAGPPLAPEAEAEALQPR